MRKIHEDEVRQVHDDHHGPQPEFETSAINGITAQYSAQHQSDHARRSVNPADLGGGKPQTAFFPGIQQERGDHFHQLGLGEAIK